MGDSKGIKRVSDWGDLHEEAGRLVRFREEAWHELPAYNGVSIFSKCRIRSSVDINTVSFSTTSRPGWYSLQIQFRKGPRVCYLRNFPGLTWISACTPRPFS